MAEPRSFTYKGLTVYVSTYQSLNPDVEFRIENVVQIFDLERPSDVVALRELADAVTAFADWAGSW